MRGVAASIDPVENRRTVAPQCLVLPVIVLVWSRRDRGMIIDIILMKPQQIPVPGSPCADLFEEAVPLKRGGRVGTIGIGPIAVITTCGDNIRQSPHVVITAI